MAHRLAPEAAAALDEIWYELATASGREDIADRVVDNITQRFSFLPAILKWAVSETIFVRACAAFLWGTTSSFIASRAWMF